MTSIERKNQKYLQNLNHIQMFICIYIYYIYYIYILYILYIYPNKTPGKLFIFCSKSGWHQVASMSTVWQRAVGDCEPTSGCGGEVDAQIPWCIQQCIRYKYDMSIHHLSPCVCYIYSYLHIFFYGLHNCTWKEVINWQYHASVDIMSRHGPESDQCHFRFRSISMFKCQDPILIWSKHVVSNYVYIHYIYIHTHISTLHNVYIYIHTRGLWCVYNHISIYLSIYIYPLDHQQN